MLVTARIASIFVSSTAVYIYDFLEVRYTSLRLLWDKVILTQEETHFFNLNFVPWKRYVEDFLRSLEFFIKYGIWKLSRPGERMEKEMKSGKNSSSWGLNFFLVYQKIADNWVKCWPAIFISCTASSMKIHFQ